MRLSQGGDGAGMREIPPVSDRAGAIAHNSMRLSRCSRQSFVAYHSLTLSSDSA